MPQVKKIPPAPTTSSGASAWPRLPPKDFEPKHWMAGIDTHLTGTRNMTQNSPDGHF